MINRLVVFTDIAIVTNTLSSQTKTTLTFNSFDEFLMSDVTDVVFIIEQGTEDFTHDILWKIRTHPKFFYLLCYVNAEINEQDKYLIDGINLPETELTEQVLQFDELINSFRYRKPPLFRDDRLLKYLWPRPNFIIQPYHDWSQRRFYSYPLLDALVFNEIFSFDWITNLLLKRILVKQQLVDRQRECSYCHSSHLSFIDVCPNCSGLNLIKQVALHCFICGNVGSQDDFLKTGSLICPKCSTRLKHIGSDYDRPIENYSCNDCNHFFIEGKILARCSVCRKSSETEELVAHEIYSLQLSELGRITAIRGPISDVLAVFSGKNFVTNEVFVHDLDWMLLLNDRYKEVVFSVVGIYFLNLSDVINATGKSYVLQRIEGIAERIRELLRDTDLCTRSTENVLWIMLPQIHKEGLNYLISRLTVTIEGIQETHNNQSKLSCKYTEYLSDQRIKTESAELLLARLQSKIL
jgi:GGDEF domain-containing protein